MGLDAGIRIKKNYRKLPKWFRTVVAFPHNWEKDCEDYDGIDICYWRNEWDFARIIERGILKRKLDADTESYPLTYEQVKQFYEKIKFYLTHPEEWNEIGHWEYDECVEIMKQHKDNLFWLLLLMKFKPHIKVVFYASF